MPPPDARLFPRLFSHRKPHADTPPDTDTDEKVVVIGHSADPTAANASSSAHGHDSDPDPDDAKHARLPVPATESLNPSTAEHTGDRGDQSTFSSSHHTAGCAPPARKNRVPFYRRRHKRKASPSEGSSAIRALVNPAAKDHRRKRRSSHSGSFLAQLAHHVVPCISRRPSASKPKREKSRRRDAEKSASSDDAAGPSGVPMAIDTDILTPTHIPPYEPPSPTDSDVIIAPPQSARLLPEEETDGVTSGAVQPPGSTGGEVSLTRTHTRESLESEGSNVPSEEEEDGFEFDEQAEEDRLIRNGGTGVPIGEDGIAKPLLPPILPEHVGRKCLVLDLDETLVHSSFKPVPGADFTVPVEIEYQWHQFHVLKRPGVDDFLKAMGELYEVVVFTASLSKYADPVLDILDIHQAVTHRLFRESCYNHRGNYVKDLSQLGRPVADTLILDNSPASYIFHPTNAVPVSSWFNDPHDAELTDLVPFLADLTRVEDVRPILDAVR